jgi:tRNA nucleotidyltransferase (CCA-adding enzyme)
MAGAGRTAASDFRIYVPEDVRRILETIENAGYEAYVVGGCVRDCALGLPPHDWDITTSALPLDIKRLFYRTVDTGIKHGTVTVMSGSHGYEVTTYRIDGTYADGRHPDNVEFTDRLSEDLKRRDFTINAMAYSDSRGLVDLFGGREDLARHVVRCVGIPYERFGEDALRMMRAIRFSAQLGFSIEKDTADAIVDLADNIKLVSMERVQAELTKTLLSPNPAHCSLYTDMGLFRKILPEIDQAFEMTRREKTIRLLESLPADKTLRYAGLLYFETPQAAVKTLRHLKMDNQTIRGVKTLLMAKDIHIEENEASVRRALHTYGPDDLKLIAEFDDGMTAAKEKITGFPLRRHRAHRLALDRLLETVVSRNDPVNISDLNITGSDLMAAGFEGREIGEILDRLLSLVIEKPELNKKEILEGYVNRMSGRSNMGKGERS